MKKLKEGDRVKRADWEQSDVPAYRDMVGTVRGFDWSVAIVEWDMDRGKISRHPPECLTKMEREDQALSKLFIIWDPSDGSLSRDLEGQINTSGIFGRISADNVYLTTYATYPQDSKSLLEMDIGERMENVCFSLSGERGYYDIVRVR